MSNDILRNFALGLAIIMLGLWGGTLIITPGLIADMFSNEPVNHSFAGMMGAALLGLAFISLASITHLMTAQRALGFAMLILVAEAAYLMLGASGAMLVTPLTTTSLVSAAAVAFFLIF